MPRDGSGIYSIPPGTQGAPDTTIESAKYNAFAADLETDLNAVRPIIAGGTGSNTAAGTRASIQAERTTQPLTNFDADPLEAGSFYSAAGATNAPVAGNAFTGIIYGPNAANMVIEARDQTTGLMWVRRKTAGVWGAWSADASDKVAKAGDTMTGDLSINKAMPRVFLDRPDSSSNSAIVGRRGGLARWTAFFGGNDPESSGDAGSSFYLSPHTDAGVQKAEALTGSRATSLLTVAGNPTAALGVATKQYVDAAIAAIPAAIREVPAGSLMLFYNNAAPAGWVRTDAYVDRAMRIASVGGTLGGVYGFSTIFGRYTTDNWTLSVNDTPLLYVKAHDGGGFFNLWSLGGAGPGQGYFARPNYEFPNAGQQVNPGAALQTAGTNGAHNHVCDMRVAYVDVIVCSKS